MLGIALPLAVVVVVFAVLLPRIADYGAVWEVVRRLSPAWIALLLAVAVVNLATFGPPWMAALPGLGYRRSMLMSQASTALSAVVPGGDAAGAGLAFAMLRSWGFSGADVTLAVIVATVWNQFVNVGLPVVALVALTLEGEDTPLLATAALTGVAVLVAAVAGFALVLHGERRAGTVGELAARLATWLLGLVGRPAVGRDWGPALIAFRRRAFELIRRRWAALTATQLAGHLTVFLVLLVALRAAGVSSAQVNVAEAFAAWALVRLLTAVPITPGGIGVVELGLTGALVGFGGPQVRVVAAVLLYRALAYVPPIPIGAVCALVWTRREATRVRTERPGSAAAVDERVTVEGREQT